MLPLLLLLATRQVEEGVVQWRAQRVVALPVSLAARLVVLVQLVVVLLCILDLLLLVVVVAEGLLAAVTRRFRRLLDDDHAHVVASLVETQVGAGSVSCRFHIQFLRLAQLREVLTAVSFWHLMMLAA